MYLRITALVFFGVAALAQQTESKPATIEGTILNSVTKAPLRKVDVTLTNGEMSQEMAAMMEKVKMDGPAPQLPKVATLTMGATTDASGRFRFEKVAPGTYWLKAKKAGFGDASYSTKGSESLRISAGQELKGVDFDLVPNATLSGRVLDEDGEPLPGAMVSALKYRYTFGHRQLSPVDTAQTSNKGEFSLSKVPPGRYYLCADMMKMEIGVKAPPPPADGSPETAYVGTYMPNTTDATQAQRIDVQAGAELTNQTIQMQKSKVVRVSGRLTDANGEPMKNAQIMLMGGGGRIGSMSMSMSDAQGRFELTNLQAGAYTAMTIQMQGGTPKMSMQTLMVPDHSVSDVVLGSHAEATIQGTVALDGDAKVELENFPVNLMPSGGVIVMPVFGKADERGQFTLRKVTPAVYDLHLSFAPEGTYVKSVVFNDREALGQPLDLSAITTGTLRIVLGADGGKTDIKVMREDKPAANATVVLAPADPTRRFPVSVSKTTTDDTGHAKLNDIAPGDYLAFAWEQVEDEIWFDADFMKEAAAQAVKVQVSPKGSQEIELKLIPAAK